MDYQQSREYLRQAQTYGSVLGLDNMREMMKRLGNPQDQLKYIHVAGTNGKGSVLAYLSSVLAQTGYRVGRYVSPAIFSYREQFEINQKPISREAFARCLSKVAQVADAMEKEGKPHPTPFEMETATAFSILQKKTVILYYWKRGWEVLQTLPILFVPRKWQFLLQLAWIIWPFWEIPWEKSLRVKQEL